MRLGNYINNIKSMVKQGYITTEKAVLFLCILLQPIAYIEIALTECINIIINAYSNKTAIPI